MKAIKTLFNCCLISILLIAALTGCREEQDGYTIYHIAQGNHECDGWRGETATCDQAISFFFTPACLYDPSAINAGYSKLWGFSQGDVHYNSLRLAWRSCGRYIELALYAYTQGKRTIIPIDSVAYMHPYDARIWWEDGKYLVSVNGRTVSVPQPESLHLLWQCYPYFGGVDPAPWSMDIYIKTFNQ